MAGEDNVVEFRVRYSETDQMGTIANARALEWFECGRTEFLRQVGLPYAQVEARGVFLPVIEAFVRYRGRASYDDRLRMTTRGAMLGKARLRCEVSIAHADSGTPVAQGYTVHAFVDRTGRPVRPPTWFTDVLEA